MKKFKSILVGVDLSWCDSLVGEELSEPNQEAVDLALWLAKINGASIEFLFSLDLSAKAQQLLEECSADEVTILDKANSRLAGLVARAGGEGISAESRVVIGRSWIELIQQVLRNNHDLVVVGTRHHRGLEESVIGSTGQKLLRKCPCAVWVTKPKVDELFDSILVAHDLREVGDEAMQLGCSMAQLHNARLQVVHAAEYPELDSMFPSNISAERKKQYEQTAREHIESQLAATELPYSAEIHYVEEPPDQAILACIEKHLVDLVVMGTVGRTGISGFITGNTAERLMHKLPCSLLAVKPPGFETPITVENE